MWDKIILLLTIVVVIVSFIGVIYVLIKKPNETVTIKTRSALMAIIALGLLLIKAYLS